VHSNAQDSYFVVNTTCWICGGKGHKASDCSSKKLSPNSFPIKTEMEPEKMVCCQEWFRVLEPYLRTQSDVAVTSSAAAQAEVVNQFNPLHS